MLQLPIPTHLSQKGLECNCRLCQNIKEGQQDPGKIFLNSLTDVSNKKISFIIILS